MFLKYFKGGVTVGIFRADGDDAPEPVVGPSEERNDLEGEAASRPGRPVAQGTSRERDVQHAAGKRQTQSEIETHG